jgi:hypothetical protein
MFIIPIFGIAQNRFAAKLPIRGGTEGFAISGNEKIWIATKTGNTYFTEKLGKLWHFGNFGSKNKMDIISGQTFDRINYINDSILIISGFIQENGKQNFIYRSTNDGANWNKVIFGKSSWIDAFYSNGKGKIWMSGSSQLIYYSNDYGKTWKEFDKVEKKGNLRFSTIHFSKNDSIGLFGSFWNVIYKTTDNCQTWEKIPTPLSQKKYSRLSKKDRPDIRKIRIFNEYFIVNQQGRIYYTKTDSINWIRMPDVIDFEVTKNRKTIYLVNKDLSVQAFNNELKSVWKSSKELDKLSLIETQNNNLYVFTYNNIYRINKNEFSKFDLLIEIPIPEPYQKVVFNNENIGFEKNRILKYDTVKNAWFNYMTVPFEITNSTVFNKQLIISDATLKNRYKVELEKKEIVKYSLPDKLFSTESNKIVSIRFENGSLGCFHHYLSFKEYKRKDNIFRLKDKSKRAFNKLPKTLEEFQINKLVEYIDTSRFITNKKSDLDITEKDISKYVKYIKKEIHKINKKGYDRFDNENLYHFPSENTDFDFYIDTIIRFDSIPDYIVNKVFNIGYGNWSTTMDWSKIIITFQDNSVLTISNSDDKPNYLGLPWIINYNGIIFKSNSIKLGKLINEITKGQMINKEATTKKYALFRIADFMYKQKINNE